MGDPSALGTAAEPIDESVLDGYRFLQEAGCPDVVTEFIDSYLADLPGRIEALHAAVAAGDPPRVRSAAHALKGSSASLGATAVASVCGRMEAAARAGDVEAVRPWLSELDPEIHRAVERLKAYRVV